MISAVISVAAARNSRRASESSLHATSRASELAQEADQAAVEASRHAERANAIHARLWAEHYFDAVRGWADEATCAIARAIHLEDAGLTDASRELFELRSTLSALLDRGRWYFPNLAHDATGHRNEPAYRGVRRPILDHLWSAYAALGRDGQLTKEEQRRALVTAQRSFVSEVQRILDPRAREREIALALESFRGLDKLRQQAVPAPEPRQASGVHPRH